MKNHAIVRAGLLSGSLFLSLCPLSCGGSSEAPPCPSYVVTPDGAVTGFEAVGEWRTDSVCAQYCESDYPVCQLQTEGAVKCQKGCG